MGRRSHNHGRPCAGDAQGWRRHRNHPRYRTAVRSSVVESNGCCSGDGLIQANDFEYRLSDGPLGAKVQVVGIMIGLVVVHQITAKRTSAALRGTIQGAILALSLLTFWLAVTI